MKNTYRTQTNIVPLDVLGGRMYAERLKAEGVMSIISSKTGFMRRQAADTRGRALIAKEMLPYGVCACRWIAAWIWTGENFPRNVDIISDRHFRAKTHGKTILTHNQNIASADLTSVAGLKVTTPLRTACDIACLDETENAGANVRKTVKNLMNRYKISCSDCFDRLWTQPAIAGRTKAAALLSGSCCTANENTVNENQDGLKNQSSPNGKNTAKTANEGKA